MIYESRKRTEKNEKNRVSSQDDMMKKPVSDFGSKALNEYLLGSRKMKPFPVAMSLVASYISGVTILGKFFSFFFGCSFLLEENK